MEIHREEREPSRKIIQITQCSITTNARLERQPKMYRSVIPLSCNIAEADQKSPFASLYLHHSGILRVGDFRPDHLALRRPPRIYPARSRQKFAYRRWHNNSFLFTQENTWVCKRRINSELGDWMTLT
jgi:hypothetical protein